jgi:hypothetical protein
MKNAASDERKRTGPHRSAAAGAPGPRPARRTPTARAAPASPAGQGSDTGPRPSQLGRTSHPAHASADDRLARSLAFIASRSALARHRERVTAIESEEDGVTDDEERLADAARAEMDADEDGLHRQHPLS